MSEKIDPSAFALSFLKQPLLYIRLRPGKEQKVLDSLRHAQIPFQQHGKDCIALPNATVLEKLVQLNREVVVQDLNSQKVFNSAALAGLQQGDNSLMAWDCCAASGGKSILLYDRLKGNVRLTVSDIRTSILANLKKRLVEASVPVFKTLVADLEQGVGADTHTFFDLIICDAPCTGSGTWSRTPEQLAFFKPELIDSYSNKQKKIASHALTRLRKNGLFFYITCSVFKKENEDVVKYLQNEFSLELLSMEWLTGYEAQADSMFVAVLKN